MHALLKILLIGAALAAGGAGAASPAADAPGRQHGAAGDRLLLVQADGPTLDEAVEQVRRRYNGRIVSAETRIRGNREVHYIKVLTKDGKVKTERIRGRTRGN